MDILKANLVILVPGNKIYQGDSTTESFASRKLNISNEVYKSWTNERVVPEKCKVSQWLAMKPIERFKYHAANICHDFCGISYHFEIF